MAKLSHIFSTLVEKHDRLCWVVKLTAIAKGCLQAENLLCVFGNLSLAQALKIEREI
ncbi:MAG: hypothetical protein JO150_07005 [Acidobacteriaceae bacterium]|nr:hypothetical protein [Acidobacteriaceae bacterium]